MCIRDRIIGAQIEPAMGPPMQYQRLEAARASKAVIVEVHEEFARIFGRRYDPFIEEYRTDDAEVVLFQMGAHAETAKVVVDKLRNHGEKVGVVRLRSFRPFPTGEVRESLSRFKAVGVVDNSVSYGIASGGGRCV